MDLLWLKFFGFGNKQSEINEVRSDNLADMLRIILDDKIPNSDQAELLHEHHKGLCLNHQIGPQLLDVSDIRTKIIQKFQYLYSNKYRDSSHLYNVANPEKKQKIIEETSHSFKPEIIAKGTQNILDSVNTSKVL